MNDKQSKKIGNEQRRKMEIRSGLPIPSERRNDIFLGADHPSIVKIYHGVEPA